MTTAVETPTKVPPVGLHRGIAYEAYSRWPAINHSILRLFNRTAAHAREELVNPKDQSEAQAQGHACHVALLEPDRFEMEFVAAPKIDKRYKEGKLEWAAFQAANASKTVVTADEFALALKMRDAVWSHPTAAEILRSAGPTEASLLWQSEGTDCKARLDKLGAIAGWPVIADLKTTKDAGQRAFSRDIYYYHYAQQGAYYLDGAQAIAAHDRKFVFIAVEKEAPFAVAVYELEQDAIDQGRIEYEKHLAQYARCLETGVWGGYGDGMGYVSLPSWAFKFHGEEG